MVRKLKMFNYRSLIGSLLYATITRLDISHVVGVFAQFMQSPTCVHLNVGRKVLQYLKGTINHGLFYDKVNDLTISAFSDADWTGSMNDRRSTSGYVFLLGTTTISWSSKKQPTVALSSTEAEYRAMTNAICEAMWIKKLMKDLCIENLQIIIYCDNMSSIYLANNPVFQAKRNIYLL